MSIAPEAFCLLLFEVSSEGKSRRPVLPEDDGASTIVHRYQIVVK
jgi:hypothetical protein